MTTLHRVSYIDRKGFVLHEWFPTMFTSSDRANELDVLGMESIDIDEVEIPWEHLSDLIHWLNHTPNSPNLKADHMHPDLAMANMRPYLAHDPDVDPAHVVAEVTPTPAPTAPQLLAKAASIMEERGRQYDKPGGERSMGKTVEAFNIITGQDLTEAEGWLLMQILKDVRQWQRPGYHQDSAEDCIAYSALKAEAKSKE